MENVQIAKIEQQTLDVAALADVLVVTTKEENEVGNSYLKVLKNIRDEISKEFDGNIDSADTTLKGLRAQKDKYAGPIKKAEVLIKQKMGMFLAEQAKKLQEAQAKIDEDAKKTGLPTVKLAMEKPKGQVVKDNWHAVVVAKSKIPLEYLEPNMQMLNGIARATKAPSKIPGVEFKKEISVTTRRI